MRSPGDFFFFFFVDGRNQYRWKCSDALTETSDTYIFLKLEKVQRLSSKSNPLFHRRRCWDQKHEGTCLGMWAFSLWVSGLKVICVPYCAPAQWAAKFRLLENPDLIFLRSCTISCTESVCKKKKKKRGMGNVVSGTKWVKRGSFVFLLLKGLPCSWVRLAASHPVDQGGGYQSWLPMPISWVGLQNPKALGPQPRSIKSGWGRERECEHHTR